MTKILAFDIGSSSVGSAWIDTKRQELKLAVSIFPAGVESSDSKRGAPKNQKRRQTRAQRRSIRRRAERNLKLRSYLIDEGFLPSNSAKFSAMLADEKLNPWHLRRDALTRELSLLEFGRVIMHLNQRRGALGVEVDPDNPDEGKVKEAIDRTRDLLQGRTFGQYMAELFDEDVTALESKPGHHVHNAIRNRRDTFRFHADRQMIREEFDRIWAAQKGFGGKLSLRLTDDLKQQFDNDDQDDTWRHQGLIFGQRATYWDTGTLGRCDLEPTEHRCPKVDMYAQEFLTLETVNNIRISKERGPDVTLEDCDIKDARAKVLAALRTQKTASVATIRRALGIHKKEVKAFYTLSIERDPDRSLNTDWFYRSFILGVFGEEAWEELSEKQRDSVNRAVLKFDPQQESDAAKLRAGVQKWWALDEDQADAFIEAWKQRPKLDNRVNLSRKALKNLLPFLREGKSVSEARQQFAEFCSESELQAKRYGLGGRPLTKKERHFVEKHPDLLPPAPKLTNPVVRKAIHEVRRHLNEYLRHPEFGKPDRVVIELARSARQSEKVRNETLARNRRREKQRQAIIEQFKLQQLSENQQRRACERVLLCRQQRGMCAYTNEESPDGAPGVCAYTRAQITEAMAANGTNLEVDHIVPRSRSQDNSMNNKVLVFRDANRDKANRTVKEWLGADSDAFQALLQRLRHFGDGKPVESYFSKKDYSRKWENLNRDAPATEEFVSSQLTDTAYASKQVAAYIREALFQDGADNKRKVFTTKGRYTAVLRRDWGLLEGEIDRESQRVATDEEVDGRVETAVARRSDKDRRDHLHHAVDAVAIAFCTGEIIKDLAGFAKAQEIARANEGRWPRRETIPPPWGTVESFRQQVQEAARQLVVSHRPVKRKLVGAFHEETLYGPVLSDLPIHRTESADSLFTNRISADGLKPNHLRVPDGWDELSMKLDNSSLTPQKRRSIRRSLAKLVDPPPAKSGIVRDRELRDQIRKSLRRCGVDPDGFSGKEIKTIVESNSLKLPSGVPIKSVVLLRTNTEPVIIPRKKWDDGLGRMVADVDENGEPDARTRRVYIGGNNHHVEVSQDDKNGKWSGVYVDTFTAAKRVRIENRQAVNRESCDGKTFVLSLAEGETIFARRKGADPKDDTALDYFVVAKLERTRNKIVFVPHWDARPADQNSPIHRDAWEASPAQLKSLGPDLDTPPFKVQISALGEIRRLDD